MGRYRSPSTCRYCWGTGHTKRACPKVKEDAANGDTYAQDIIDHYAARAKSRKCSYCGECGHNKKGCKIRKAHRVIFNSVNQSFRNEIKVRTAAAGIKIGSLMQVHRRGKKVIALIEKIDIDGRIPTYDWLTKHFDSFGNQTEEQSTRHSSYRGYQTSLSEGFEEPTMLLRSLSGSGLGYWCDSGAAPYGLLDILDKIEKNDGDSYEIVSEA